VDFVGLLTLNKIEVICKKLEDIEKHLVDLDKKINTTIKENNSIKNQISELKK
jgi:peptidoglycan hydrolase CwlO-like protein